MQKQNLKTKVYIDGANFFYIQKKLGWSLDWKKVKKFLEKDRNIVELRYYTGIKEDDEKMKKFLEYLEKLGYTIITKPLKVIKVPDDKLKPKINEYHEVYKSNFDVEISVDILIEKDSLDEIILFSGDSDFEYLVKKLKDLKKNVVIFASRGALSKELKSEGSRFLFLENIKSKIKK